MTHHHNVVFPCCRPWWRRKQTCTSVPHPCNGCFTRNQVLTSAFNRTSSVAGRADPILPFPTLLQYCPRGHPCRPPKTHCSHCPLWLSLLPTSSHLASIELPFTPSKLPVLFPASQQARISHHPSATPTKKRRCRRSGTSRILHIPPSIAAAGACYRQVVQHSITATYTHISLQ